MRFPLRSALVYFCFALISVPATFAQEVELSADEKKEQLATERFTEILRRKPRTGTALDRVYDFHIARGTLDSFCEKLQSDIQEKNDGQAALLLGLIQSRRGNDGEARLALEQAEQRLKDEPLPSYYLGKTLLLLGDTQTAIAAFQRAIDRKPDKADSLAIFQELGRVYQRARRSEDAVNVWKKMEAMFPGDVQVQEQIANVLEEEGAREEALTRFAALASSTKDRFRQVELGVRAASLKMKLNRSDEALKDFETLLTQVNPGSWLHQDIRQRIDESFLSRQDTPGLTAYYQRWIDQHPDDIDAMMRVGRLLSIARNSSSAKEWFARATERAPSAVEPRLALIEALERDGSYAAAASAMQALCELKPENLDYLVRWGELLLADYSRPEDVRAAAAADVWRKLLVQKDSDPVMVSRVADLMRSANLSDEAIKLYTRAVELADSEPQYREYLGEYLHRLGRSQEALKVWQELASGPRRNRDNLVRLSEVLGTFGFKSQALEVLSEACQLQPTFGHRLRFADKLIESGRFHDALTQLELANRQATNEDEQDLVLELQIKAHTDAGSLAKHIEERETALEQADAGKSPTAWKQLALFQEADGKTQAALNSINQAMELATPSAGLINIAARIQEKAGLTGDAIASLRKLIALDRRGQARILMQIASMQVRLGQLDKAVQTAQEMLATSDASTEQYRYYSELCFQAGRIDQGLDALRRHMRANPNNRESIDLLARALSNNFKTDEAIELTWRSFAKANSTGERIQSVQSLTELYLRTNAFDDLLKRLENYGREENRAREALQLSAAAQQASGDLSAARQLLEPLAADSRDTELLNTLVELARADGDWEAAANYQKQLNSLSPTTEGNMQLAKFLLEKGDVEQAEAIWKKFASEKITPEEIQSNMRQLMDAGETTKVLAAVERALKSWPENWEVLAMCMQMLYRCDKDDQAQQLAKKILAMKLPLDSLSESAKRQRSRQASGAQPSSPSGRSTPGLVALQDSTERMASMSRSLSLVQALLVEREQGLQPRQINLSSVSIVCFGDARLIALYIADKRDETSSEGPEMDVASEIKPDALWDAAFLSYFRRLDANAIGGMSGFANRVFLQSLNGTVVLNNFQRTGSSLGTYLSRLADLGDQEAQLAMCGEYLREYQVRQAMPNGVPELVANAQTDGSDKLDKHFGLLKKVQALPNVNQYDQVILLSIHVAEALKTANRLDESQQLLQFVKQSTRTSPKISYATSLVAWDVDAAIDMFLAAIKQASATSPSSSPSLNPMSVYSNQMMETSTFFTELLDRQQAVAGLETRSATADINRANPLRLITELKKLQAERARRMRPSQVSTYTPSNPVRFLIRRRDDSGMGGGIGAMGGGIGAMGSMGSVTTVSSIPFPAASALQSSDLLTAMYMVHQFPNNLYRDELERLLKREAEQADQDAMQSAVDHLCWSIWLWWSDRREESLKELELVRQTSAVSDLVSMLASRMYYDLGRPKDALQQLQSLKPTTAQLMQERELAILQLASQTGDNAMAKQAAERLFAMRLPANTQMQVAKVMQQLGMHELGNSMLQRLQHRGGNQLETLNQLMLQYQREKKTQAAEEIARQIVRRTRSSNNRNSAAMLAMGGRNNNESYRRQALEVLAGAPETARLITELEEKLKANPKAPSVINQLAELYEATGKSSEANKLLERIRPKPIARSTATTTANRLTNLRQNRSVDSVKTYLELFEKTPSLIDQEYIYFSAIVQQTNAWDTVGNTISQWPINKISTRRWSEMLGRVLDSSSVSTTDRLVKKMLESDNFLNLYGNVFALRSKRIRLSDETRSVLTQKLAEALANPNFVPNNIGYSGVNVGHGFLTAINNLSSDPVTSKTLLQSIAPLADAKPHLKCLQVLLLAGNDDRPTLEQRFKEVMELPVDANQLVLQELATQLTGKNHQDLAIPLLLRILEAKPVEFAELNPKGLLLTCYEQKRDFEKAKPLLDEAFTSLQKSKMSGISFGIAQTTIQASTRLAERYMQAGYNLDALAVLYWIKNKPELLNTVQQIYGTNNNPFTEPLTRLEGNIRDRLDAHSLVTLLRSELQLTAEAHAKSTRLTLPDAMFVPDINAINENNVNATTQIRQLMTRLNESESLRAELKDQLVTLSQKNWADLSARGLICATYLADYLNEKQSFISAAKALNAKFATADVADSVTPAANKPTEWNALRPACWLIAEQLIPAGEPALAQELAAHAQPKDLKPSVEVLNMRLRLAKTLSTMRQTTAAQTQLQALLDDLYPAESSNATTPSAK